MGHGAGPGHIAQMPRDPAVGARARSREAINERHENRSSCGIAAQCCDPRDRRSRRLVGMRCAGSSSPRRSTCAPARAAACCGQAADSLRERHRGGQREAASRGRASRSCPAAPSPCFPGPTFAHEVATGPADRGHPCRRGSCARRAAARAHRSSRPSAPIVSDDVAGAEIGGAVKNVLAIACGVVEGKGLGQNARAALIARGFAEMTRFGLACGASARLWPACPGSATSSSPARRPARAIIRSARASARAAPPPSCSPTAGPWPKAHLPRRCWRGWRGRRASTCRS